MTFPASEDELGDEPDGTDDPLVDENLAALAQAEAEVEAIDARIAAGDRSLPYETVALRIAAARRQRGSALWGAASFVCGVAACAWLVGSGLWKEFTHLSSGVTYFGRGVEGGLILGAVVLGTVGCRRVAGRRMAIAGRIIGWGSPGVGWLLAAGYSTFHGTAEGEMVIAVAGAIVIMALGLFAFATLDALVVP